MAERLWPKVARGKGPHSSPARRWSPITLSRPTSSVGLASALAEPCTASSEHATRAVGSRAPCGAWRRTRAAREYRSIAGEHRSFVCGFFSEGQKPHSPGGNPEGVMWCSLLPAGSTDKRSEASAAPRGGLGAPRPLGQAHSGPPGCSGGPTQKKRKACVSPSDAEAEAFTS